MAIISPRTFGLVLVVSGQAQQKRRIILSTQLYGVMTMISPPFALGGLGVVEALNRRT